MYSYRGYFFDPTAFKPLIGELRSQIFQFHDTITQRAQELKSQALNKTKSGDHDVVIGIHVRRGDMLLHIKSGYGGKVVGKSYFDQAKKRLIEDLNPTKPAFLIVSDDRKWCEDNLVNEEDDTVFAGDEDGSAGVDLALLSLCDHVIFSHGTFGMWGALLSGGRAVMAEGFGERETEELKGMREEKYPGWTFLSEE